MEGKEGLKRSHSTQDAEAEQIKKPKSSEGSLERNDFEIATNKFADFVSHFTSNVTEADYAIKNSSHFSRELLRYDQDSRADTETAIVSHMEWRKAERMQGNAYSSRDKSANPLIAVPGSPGIGKSAFIAHFPLSEAYSQYRTTHFEGRSPIVIAFTFNSHMDGCNTPDSLARRILFGAAMCMRDVDKEIADWHAFHTQFKNWPLDVIDTLHCIHEVYGKNRPLLLLVDEISKVRPSKNHQTAEDAAKDVITEIGSLLSVFHELDVVVTSLSETYLQSLLTDSQRELRYVVLPTLQGTQVAHDLCVAWMQTHVLAKSTRQPSEKGFVCHVLDNAHLLFADYPRALERTFSRDNPALAELIVAHLQSSEREDSAKLVMKIVEKLAFDTKNVVLGSASTRGVLTELETIFEYVLDWKPHNDISDDPDLRKLISAPFVFMARNVQSQSLFVEDHPRYFAAISPILLLGYALKLKMRKKAIDENAPFCFRLSKLFSDLEGNPFSTWFERTITLAIATRPLDETSQGRFGVHLPIPKAETSSSAGKVYPEIVMAKNENDCRRREEDKGSIVVAYEHSPGFDGFVTMLEEFVVYLQMKCSKSAKSKAFVRCKALLHTLDFHLSVRLEIIDRSQSVDENSTDVQNAARTMALIFYDWDDDSADSEDGVEVRRNELIAELASPALAMYRCAKLLGVLLAQREVELKNPLLRVMKKRDMQSWLPPTLALIPDLVNAFAPIQESSEVVD